MNRVIKFRAWHEDAHKMTDLYLGEDDIAVYSSDGEIYTLRLRDEPPVMQFTGLKDKNGKEIYEGDVVEFHDLDYPDGHTALHSIHRHTVEFLGGAYQVLSSMPSEEFEVIGNIYQHPELLGETNE